MFERAKNGWQIIASAIRAFAKYPELLVPLLFSWAMYAGIVLYLHFILDWNALSSSAVYLLCFGVVLSFSTMLCFSASWLLEMIEQIETGKPLKVGAALSETIDVNLVRMLPIALLWATVWFALILVDVLTSNRKSDRDDDKELNFKNATQVLSGADNDLSWTSLSIDMIQKLVRMLVFLSLPAVCWRAMPGASAMGEGLMTARKHTIEFFTGYMLTGSVAALLFLPVVLPGYLDAKEIIHLPDVAWPVMFVYLAFAWSFSIYIEQMFTAELYMWHMNWEKAVKHARVSGAIEPKLSEVKRPSLLDDVADLVEFKSARAVPTTKAYSARQANELLRTYGAAKFSCWGCNHEFKFSSLDELAKHDYDMDSSNGIQLKCPGCSNVTTYNPAKKRA